jgi:hypothetical protein
MVEFFCLLDVMLYFLLHISVILRLINLCTGPKLISSVVEDQESGVMRRNTLGSVGIRE